MKKYIILPHESINGDFYKEGQRQAIKFFIYKYKYCSFQQVGNNPNVQGGVIWVRKLWFHGMHGTF